LVDPRPGRAETRWSLGIILFECLFGYPPFWANTKRITQKLILDWTNSLEIPLEPRTSDSAKHLLRGLLCGANERLRTPTWEVDLATQSGHPVSTYLKMQIFEKDVRNHQFFRIARIDFEDVHLTSAPCLPREKSTSPILSKQSAGRVEQTDKSLKARDILLYNEQVLKERGAAAFKNYTYRGRDIGLVLERFADAFENKE
jgi:serine/threonine protein kinase